MRALSVVVITYNEEEKIGRCLESVQQLADEIVIVDSCSTDRTEEIVRRYNVKFISQPFLGYIGQKNFAIANASNDMVLSLDADEAIDEKLRASILAVKQQDFPADGYTMNRLSNFANKWIRRGSWYPDVKLRLFNRTRCRFGGTNPHDRIIEEPGFRKVHLKGDIEHYSYKSFEEYITQLNRFTTIQAAAMYESGKRASFLNLWLNPLAAFIGGYFIKGGFLDGSVGLIIHATVAYQTFAKYAKLRQLQMKKQ